MDRERPELVPCGGLQTTTYCCCLAKQAMQRIAEQGERIRQLEEENRAIAQEWAETIFAKDGGSHE